MRKITKEACSNLFKKTPYKSSNTSVYQEGNDFILALHGNPIACLDSEGTLQIRHADRKTNTTKERLNGVLYFARNNKRIKQNRGLWFIVGEKTEVMKDGRQIVN